MAAASVIHFGSDDPYRVPALRNAGYEVRESDSLDRLRMELERDENVDAVIVSETEPPHAEQAADLARQHCRAPVILFRPPQHQVDESRFDRVFSWFIPEAIWLYETAVLVMRTKELTAESQRLQRESEKARKESRRQRERAQSERKRNADVGGLWKLEGSEKD
jgi:hypothetical protein